MTSLYERDVLAWSEEQADALRALGRSDVGTEADWERLACGIERVGGWARNHVETGIRTMLMQAAAGYCDPDSLRRHERLVRTSCGQCAARDELTPTIRERVDLDRLWREAVRLALTQLQADQSTRKVLGLLIDPEADALKVPAGIPGTCPFTMDELLAEDFTYDWAVEQLYVRLTSWRPKLRSGEASRSR